MEKTRLSEQVIALERQALDRWCNGDPDGYLKLDAPEITYFDPVQEKRVDGLDAMKAVLEPLRGKFQIDRYDMIDPRVQIHGEVAVLTYNLVDYVSLSGKAPLAVRWNCTEVYALLAGEWKIIHNHWSYIKPELKQPIEV
jgi:ketosteroid isomerase-like protein